MSFPIQLAATHLADDAGLFAGMGALIFVIWGLGIVLTIFWIWMLIDCLSSSMPSTEKLIWVVVMVVIPVIGSILYFFMKRQPRSGGITGGTLRHA
jgi:hypothetical protein